MLWLSLVPALGQPTCCLLCWSRAKEPQGDWLTQGCHGEEKVIPWGWDLCLIHEPSTSLS